MDQPFLLDLLAALKDTEVSDRVKVATEHLYQELIDAEANAVIGAGPWQPTPERTGPRNGSRPRALTTTAVDMELRIPKLRTGSFFPSLLERRRRVDQALFAGVTEAYLHGVSTRKVDDLIKALGAVRGLITASSRALNVVGEEASGLTACTSPVAAHPGASGSAWTSVAAIGRPSNSDRFLGQVPSCWTKRVISSQSDCGA